MFEYKKLLLKDKTRLILAPLRGTAAVSLLVLFGVGSRYENRNLNGISHFLEHMMFKGTQRRPNTLALSQELDGIGAIYNAFTSKDNTGYYIKVDARHADLALDILSDMLLNSKIDEAEVNRERNVILEEIHMYKDNPMMHIEDLIEGLVFPNSSLGWPICGDRESMAKVSRQDIFDHRLLFCQPEKTVICLAGALDKLPQLTKKIERYFGRRGKFKKPKGFAPFCPVQTRLSVKVEYKDTDQVQLAIGFQSFPYLDKRLPALKIMSAILGGTMSSRLFIAIRERMGLAYFVRTMVEPYEDTGIMLIRAGLNTAKLESAIKIIMEEISKLQKDGVSSAELERVKENIRGHMTLELEDSSVWASFLAEQELLTRQIKSPVEKFKELEKVTKNDVREAAREVLQRKRLNLALIGPLKDAKKFKKMMEY